MAKIPSKFQRIFCADVSPNNVVAQFGSIKAASPVYSSDPDTLQALAAWTNGWAGAVAASNAPTIQDMNSLFYVMTRQIAYFMQTGISEWNATTTYYYGSLVNDASGNLYVSVANANINHALTESSYWMNIKSTFSRSVSGNPTVANEDYSFTWASGATGPSGEAWFPTPAATLTGRRILYHDLTQSGASVSIQFICNGSAWIFENYALIQ